MRVHRLTHPIIGEASWREMQDAAGAIRATGKRICTWCHCEIAKGLRTRCGKVECAESIWQSYSWMRASRQCIRAAKGKCFLCGDWAMEADHIIPVSLGGTGDQWNLRCALYAVPQGSHSAIEKRKGSV